MMHNRVGHECKHFLERDRVSFRIMLFTGHHLSASPKTDLVQLTICFGLDRQTKKKILFETITARMWDNPNQN